MRLVIEIVVRVENNDLASSCPAKRQSCGFEPKELLQALFEAYSRVAIRCGSDSLVLAPVLPLVDLYPLIPVLLGLDVPYSRKEFARDIYQLHSSGIDTTDSGATVTFPVSRGVPGKLLTTTSEFGEEVRYYGIRFLLANACNRSRSELALVA